MTLIIGDSFKFVAHFSRINIRLCNDVQGICITDCVDVECQPFFMAICGNNLCLLCTSVVVLDKLDYIIHVQEAWQLKFIFLRP